MEEERKRTMMDRVREQKALVSATAAVALISGACVAVHEAEPSEKSSTWVKVADNMGFGVETMGIWTFGLAKSSAEATMSGAGVVAEASADFIHDHLAGGDKTASAQPAQGGHKTPSPTPTPKSTVSSKEPRKRTHQPNVFAGKIIAAGSDAMPCKPGEVIDKVQTDKKIVSITIDDGPSLSTTNETLDVLKDTNSVATFFFLGSRLETVEGSKIAKRALAEGHEVASHSYTHRLHSPVTNATEHPRANAAFTKILGANPFAYRAPGLSYSNELRSAVKKSKQCFIGVSQNADTNDWKSDFLPRRQAEASLKTRDDEVVRNLTPGAIILVHDQMTDQPEDGGKNRKRQTAAEHIRYLINGIHERGYKLVTVEKLLQENAR
jgi:peptidoglycan/xylan/chitin deacetylase (PgdA/CDA1 family)